MTDSEDIAFWDEFAEEYTEIADESRLTIADDVAKYLLDQQILPVNSLADLACGSGRYISAFLPLVASYSAIDFSKEMLKIAKQRFKADNLNFFQLSQQEFLNRKWFFDLVFTAMNPALDTKDQLMKLLEKGQTILILRMVAEKDTLFQPYEDPNALDLLMKNYKNWLSELEIPFQQKQFSYSIKEMISKEFFMEYFEQDFSTEELQIMTDQVFGRHNKVMNDSGIIFELLIVHSDQSIGVINRF